MKHGVILVVLAACSGDGSITPDGAVDGSDLPDGDGGAGGDALSDAVFDEAMPDAMPDAMVDAGPGSMDAWGDPNLLSMQGVYGDFATRLIPSDAITYGVRWELWADGATKRRWLLLPPGARIDTSDPEHWRFPVGTRMVKEFTRDGVVVETRIVEQLATGLAMRTYVWNAAQTEGMRMVWGAQNVAGTSHDAPSEQDCVKCHQGEPGGALGISAVQLPPATLAAWAQAGRFTDPIAGPFGPTGNATEVAALGYLHGNCGHCHNPIGYAAGTNNMNLRLDAPAKPATSEPGFVSTVNVTVQGNGAGAGKRIDPMNPMNSAIVRRMSVRGNFDQMPLVGSEVVHAAGVSTVTSWVNTISP